MDCGWSSAKAAHDDATRAVIQQQEHAGVDIISDGEQRRKNYVTAVTAGMKGFDYETLGEKVMRGGRRHAMNGRCVGPIEHQGPIIADDLKFLLAHTNRRVKVTLPGAMTAPSMPTTMTRRPLGLHGQTL